MLTALSGPCVVPIIASLFLRKQSEKKMTNKILIATLLFMLSSTAFGKTAKGLSFIDDDFEKALLEAKLRNAPLFVEVWAPW